MSKTNSPPLRVVHIITCLNDGGAEAVLYRLCVSDTTHQHTVISLLNEGKYGSLLLEAGVTVYCLDMKQGRIKMSSLIHLWRILRRERPEIVQTWMYHANLVGGVVAKFAGVGGVFWGIHHTTLAPDKSKLATIYVARLCAVLSRWVPSKIVCCANKAANVHANMGYAQQKLVVIANGYDLDRFCFDDEARDRLRSKWGISLTMPLLGMVGRFDQYKDHKNLLNALGQLKLAGKTFECVLVGDGLSETNRELAGWIDAQNLRDQIILLGPRTDIPSVMNALDLHVLSSHGEAFPNVLAEAMACGTPCVTTDVGDAKLILGETGWVVPPRNSQALAQAVATALANRAGNPAAWSTRQKAARSRIVEYFSLDAMVQAYNDVWAVGRF